MKDYTIAELRDLTKEGASIRLTRDFVKKMIAADKDGIRATNDLAWLWDCTMEKGNSEATVFEEEVDILGEKKRVFKFDFSQVGCCSVGVVFSVRFSCTEDKIPQSFVDKMGGWDYIGAGMCGVFGEDVWKDIGGFLSLDAIEYAEITYDPFEDEGEDNDEEEW